MQLTVFESSGKLYTDSREVAKVVGKRHDNLVRDIGKYMQVLDNSTDLKIEVSEFFRASTYKDSTGRRLPRFDCTKMGCEMIAHKLTGNKGIIFTAIYIKQFHAMESILMERQSPHWQATRLESKVNRRLETDEIKAFIEYAKAQGSQHADKYYISLSKLANKTVGISGGRRNEISVNQLNNLILIEHIIGEVIKEGIRQEIFYKQIYQACKSKIEQFQKIAYLVA